MFSRLECIRVHFVQISVLVSRPEGPYVSVSKPKKPKVSVLVSTLET